MSIFFFFFKITDLLIYKLHNISYHVDKSKQDNLSLSSP